MNKKQLIFSGTPTQGQVIKFDVDREGEPDGAPRALYVIGTGSFAANMVVLKNPKTNSSSASDADYADVYEDGLVNYSVTNSVVVINFHGSYGVKFTTVDGPVDVFWY